MKRTLIDTALILSLCFAAASMSLASPVVDTVPQADFSLRMTHEKAQGNALSQRSGDEIKRVFHNPPAD